MKGSTKIEKFLVKGRHFTQLSDHYGVKVTLQYIKNRAIENKNIESFR